MRSCLPIVVAVALLAAGCGQQRDGSATGASAAGQAAARTVDFKGRRIEVVVPFTEGGGADSWARLVLPHLARHLPGNPTMVIKNIPGGGSVSGANYFDRHARGDGLTLLTASNSLFFTYALDKSGGRIQFVPEKWVPILSSPVGAIVFAAPKSGVRTIADLKKATDKAYLVAVASPTGGGIRFLLTLEMLGIRNKPVFGLDGGKGALAFERGEVEINIDTAAAYLRMTKPLVDQGQAYPLFTFGFMGPDGKIVRDPTFPELPTFPEVYRTFHGRDPSGPAFDAWMSFFHIGVMNSKMFVLPADTSPELVAAYDQAVREMVADPAFLKATAEELGAYPQFVGDDARRSLQSALQMSPESRAWLVDWLKRSYDVNM